MVNSHGAASHGSDTDQQPDQEPHTGELPTQATGDSQ